MQVLLKKAMAIWMDLGDREMKPVYKIPSHSTEEPKSIVFDFQVMGKVRVVFYGDNHKSDAEEFCASRS